MFLSFVGYRMTPEVIEVLLKRYSYVQIDPRSGQPACKMAFDDFVAMSVRLRSLTGDGCLHIMYSGPSLIRTPLFQVDCPDT